MELQLRVWHGLAGELSFFSLAQMICDLTNLNLHLGNRLGVHHGCILDFTNRLGVHEGGILHFINGLACKLHEVFERVL